VVSEGGALLDSAHGSLGTEGGFLFVRPEKVAVAQEAGTPAGGPNCIAGRVRFAGFLGNVLRYEVDTDQAGSLIADLVNGPGAVLHAAGDKVVLSWSREDCRLLLG
jgi:putative spermidine/putrescine transport system ATP-binding protein